MKLNHPCDVCFKAWHGRIRNARHADARRTEEQRSNITAQRYKRLGVLFANGCTEGTYERTRTIYLLITSARSGVAERCTAVQILHRNWVFCSLYGPPLQGVACGLGSNYAQVGLARRGLHFVRSFALDTRRAIKTGFSHPNRSSSTSSCIENTVTRWLLTILCLL